MFMRLEEGDHKKWHTKNIAEGGPESFSVDFCIKTTGEEKGPMKGFDSK